MRDYGMKQLISQPYFIFLFLFLYEVNIKKCSEKPICNDINCNDMNCSVSHMQNLSFISDSDTGLISFLNNKASLSNSIYV